MFRQLRDAKPEEIESIKNKSDLTDGSIVLALDTPKGPILGVVRVVTELDPVHFPEGLENRWKTTFLRDVETFMTAKGFNEYYFNLDADEASTDWRAFQEKWGAKKVFSVPTYRYKTSLLD
jgi:hypothetical protein